MPAPLTILISGAPSCLSGLLSSPLFSLHGGGVSLIPAHMTHKQGHLNPYFVTLVLTAVQQRPNRKPVSKVQIQEGGSGRPSSGLTAYFDLILLMPDQCP